jgi:hypothetical protein
MVLLDVECQRLICEMLLSDIAPPPVLDSDKDSAWPPEEQSIPPAGEPHRRPADDGHQVFNAVQQDSVEQPLVPFL